LGTHGVIRGYERLLVSRQEDLLFVQLNDPERRNALSPQMIAELTAVFRHDWRAADVRAVLLSGAGKAFSAGADLDHLRAMREASPAQNLVDSERLRDLFLAILEQPALTLALVHGACVAGGCGLATACDFVLAADDARFLYSEVRIGFVAALVATFLPLRVRGAQVRELLLDPDFLSAEQAVAIGLANRVAPRLSLEQEGRAWAISILEKASSDSIAASKRLMLDVVGVPIRTALAEAARVNAAARATADCRRGVATFLETKQPPRWRQ
jgi:methylglutaconyl-CoA hydratase